MFTKRSHKYTETKLQLKAAGLFKYVWLFTGGLSTKRLSIQILSKGLSIQIS